MRNHDRAMEQWLINLWKLVLSLLVVALFFMTAVESTGQSMSSASSSFIGAAARDMAGWDVAFVGDVNKDGYEDLLVGAPENNKGAPRAGAVYLIFGSGNLPPILTPLVQANVTFLGEKSRDEAGMKVAGVGDVNGDGFSDFICSAPMANNNAGKIYLIFGKSSGWTKEIKLTEANASFLGENPGDNAGLAIAAAGDVNKDGLNDFLIGAPRHGNKGKAYLILGKANAWQSNVNLVTANASFIGESAADLLGLSVAGVGDINKDGYDDIALGAPQYDQNGKLDCGKVYLFFGKPGSWDATVSVAKADASLLGDNPNDQLGKSISNAGDVNGDGADDFLVTASLMNSAGKIYILLGKSSGWSQNSVPETFAPSFVGEKTNDGAGVPTLIGDLDGDGLADLMIGASKNSQAADQAGKVYHIAGKTDGWNQNVSLSSAEVFMTGEKAQDYAGQALAAGDFDADGFADLAIAAPGSNTGGEDAGIVYLFRCPFKPIKAKLVLISPNGGENWLVGSQHPITWISTGKIENVRLKYSIDNGINWKNIINSTPNNGNYNWTIPNDPSAMCLVKVEDAFDGDPCDHSDQVFTISPLPIPETVTLTSPKGGEKWVVNSSHQITWNWTGSFSQVKIEYSFDNGVNWNLIDGCTANDGVYDWTIPNTPSTICLVKISDKNDGIPADVSDAVFSIILPSESITVASPNGGECWHSGSNHEIKWNSTGLISNVKIQYSFDGGKNWISIINSTPNDGIHPWIVPNVYSKNCLVKVADVDCNPEDVSDKPFTIWDKAPVTVLCPNGDECLKPGQQFKIKWEACCCLDSVKIQYSTDGGKDWKMIVKSTPNDSSFLWTVPTVHSTNCLVKVADLDCDPEDISDRPFTIWGKAPITVIAPNGGECLKAGQPFEIRWEASCDFDSLKIQYTIDGGANWTTIIYGTPNDGSYLWTLPNVHSTNCLIKVADLDCNPEDVSDKPFTIWGKAPITVIKPNGGELLTVGQQFEIRWEAACYLDSLKIQFSSDNGTNWSNVIRSTPNDGSYLWTVPNVHSDKCLIKVADLDCDPFDVSDKPFSIWGQAAPITVISPNGGECLKAGQQFEIKWSAYNLLDSVKIQYSTNGGNSWNSIVAGTPNDGSFIWTVPNVHSTNCLVKVADRDGDPADVSDKPFTIWGKADVTVLSPNGGECLQVGQQFEIKWEAICKLDSVKIQFSKDGGQDWSMIVYGTPNDGSYLWTVPNVHSKNCLIKVADLDCDPFDVSDKPFTICAPPFVTVLQPNGGECLQVGTQYQIKWHACCFMDSVKIQYSIDKGKNWQNIIAKTKNDSSFIWTVPNTPSDSCLVKVADLDCDPFDVSDKVFSIKPLPVWQVTAPNGGEVLTAGNNFEIKWTTCGYQIDTVKIQYSIDGGKNWLSIIYRTANDGSYVWKVPNTPSDSCLVKVADVDCDPFDVSDGFFTIKTAAVANFAATIMTGTQPLEVKFTNLSNEHATRWQWSFGDGSGSTEKEPVHIYNSPGNYTVQLIAHFPSRIDSVKKADFIRVHQPESFAQLQVASASPTLPQQDCSKATDGDMNGWDGTVVLEGEQPHIIFNLNNAANKVMSSIGLISNTGIGFEDRWIHRFQIQVSTMGNEASSFQTILDTAMTSDGFEVFSINPIQAKFVKLVVIAPQQGLVHLGEFEAYLTEGGTTAADGEGSHTPTKFSLAQNYPNPFNPTTTIRFELPGSSQVRLEIYNVLGEQIRMLFNGKKDAGVYEMIWDGKNKDGVTMPSGVYLCVIATNDKREIKKMILAK